MKFNLQWFVDTTYTVTCLSDSGFSAFSASPASGAKDTTVTLTVTPASGYELDGIEVAAGGVTIEEDDGVYTFDIGEANVVLFAKSKGSKTYKVLENVYTCVNGTVTNLTRNMKIVYSKSGAISAVECDGTDLSSLSADVLAALESAGVIVKI